MAAINSLYGINLTSDDYNISAFPTWAGTAGEEHAVTVTAKTGSLIFIGNADITLFIPQAGLDDVVSDTEPDGLTYP